PPRGGRAGRTGRAPAPGAGHRAGAARKRGWPGSPGRRSVPGMPARARGAGGAIGTLYGHFPTRRALVAAVLRDRNVAVLQLGDRLLTEPSVLGALMDWMRAVTRHAAAYQGLALMLAAGAENERSELHESCVHMADLTEKLTARARDAGVIRGGVTGADVSALISAAAWTAARTSAEEADRLLDLVF